MGKNKDEMRNKKRKVEGNRNSEKVKVLLK